MTAFTATPPTITIRGESVKLRAFNHGWQHLVTAVAALVDEPKMLASALIVGFAVVYSLPPSDAYTLIKDSAKLEEAIQQADIELTPEDLDAVDQYIAGIMARSQEAAVTTDGRGGKPKATATRQRKKRA